MAKDEIKSFEVTDPRKSFAGHTLYRVSAKVCHKGSSELVEKVVVWRRFSEFKKLQKDILKLYITEHEDQGQFPHLPKATFFDRFQEAVIEERRKASLNLLNFAGNIPHIANNQCFRKFFEGGIYQHTTCSSNSSRTSSFSSGSEVDITETQHNIRKSDSKQESDDPQGYLELGGVWLCKQPSLVEGLDKTETTGDETNQGQTTVHDVGGCQTPTDTPSFFQRSLSDDASEEDLELENNEGMSCDEEGVQKSKTSTWLQRAISLCSEGEDIETLASEAEKDEYIKELNFPRPFSEVEESEVSSLEENKRKKYDVCDRENMYLEKPADTIKTIVDTKGNKENELKSTTLTSAPDPIQNESREGQRTTDEGRGKNMPKPTILLNEECPGNSGTSLKESQTKTEPCRFDPQDTSILSDFSGDDYLFAAAKVVRQALNFELEGQYKEAFHLYKKCVSLLLSGVQKEKDAKCRDAVRRKTAQYLLKAEALYTTYVHESVKELPGNTPQRINAIREDLTIEESRHLQLANYSVIGVIGKVVLVENRFDKSTYVIKVLPKTEGHHYSRYKSKFTRRGKHLLKAAYAECPFIVKLHEHCETQTSVILLLEHAGGGRLWDYLTPLKRRQHQQNSATSKSQCYVHNLKETEMKKRSMQNLHNDVGVSHKEKQKFIEVVPRQNQKSFNITNYPDIEQQVFGSQNTEALNIRAGDDKLTINNPLVDDTDRNNVSDVSSKKVSTFSFLDEKFNLSSQKPIESCVRIWMAEMILALAHLHSNGIICRDLNPKNILLSNEGHIMLTHFSVWEDVNHESDWFSLDQDYCAPELFRLEEATTAADWWSVGALFYEILAGQALTTGYPWGIRSHTEIEMPSTVSAEATALIRELLIVTPSERLGSGVNGLDDIKSHPFFAGVDWSNITRTRAAQNCGAEFGDKITKCRHLPLDFRNDFGDDI